ncbi:receptor kinase-like protein Xa21 [Herrania umbratica]|uniref:Receptor kinase-like protein Xa21 n=1 Tax=Herrania umbratica TaxID=108875 RepID=A0A6J1AIS7_9ROSI|nr:receptor kinase-like protein Xa21 [Herrania umbratica]XP_021287133.1 receptor kinase-like protein Xa21 [Herrania umbratica]XP_021287134.1 receptor kinase-like protein Xa21 [Herrania umbratica]
MKISSSPCLVFLVHIFMLFAAHVYSLTDDESALLALKAYIDPGTANILASWTTKSSVCNWIGVTCGGQPQRVIALNLSSMGLDGTLPPQIGKVPSALGNITSLKKIYLSKNQLSGFITSSIFNVSSLQIIDLSFNRLVGGLPVDMFNLLPDLKELYLSGNQLHGQIPSSLFNCWQLEVLYLPSNNFTGAIPTTLGNLTMLKELYLSNNILEGRIPSSIGNCTSLTLLDLADNSFDGLIPNTIVNLKNLQKLNLAHNALTIESSTLESSFINSVTNNMHLRRIVLSGNPLDTMLPMSIGNLSTSLEYLWLTDCKLQGRIPSEVGNLSSLVALRLGNNELTGVIPSTIGRLQKLQGLHLQGNKLQGTILYDFCKLSSLFELFLSGNELSGLIPECLSNLTTLRNLSLSSNRLTSTIPSSLWSLTDILAINMSSNSLQGSLPFEIENLRVVIEIDLSKNQFSGYIPNSIAYLKSLEYLSLAVNRLEGLIPEFLGSSVSLEFLDLSHNKLSGVIPMSLVRLRLIYFNVSFNELEGEIPSGGNFVNFTAHSYVMNKALCGAPRLQVPTCRTGTSKRSRRPILTLAKILLPIIASMCILPLMYRAIRLASMRFLRQIYRAIKHCLKKREDPLLTTNRTILYQEIVLATDGFSESNIIGTGSFGFVYKGAMKEEKNVAIKVFNLHPEKGLRSFQVESELLSNTRHPNLVKLMNSCCDDDFRALVLEYMPNGTLDKWL